MSFRFPVTFSLALLVAFAASLGIHVAVLLVPKIDSASEPEALPLIAKLRIAKPEPPLPVSSPRETLENSAGAVREPPLPSSPRKPRKARKPVKPVLSTPAVTASEPFIPGATPEPLAENESLSGIAPAEAAPAEPAVPAVSSERLPPSGRIRFRVEMGDSGFEVGVARQEWSFEAGSYRIVSSVETTGLAWLVRSVNIGMESLGRISDKGLQPEVFGVMRSGKKVKERALFDWESMKIRVSSDKDHTLDPEAQDLLSLYYHLGFLDLAPGQTRSMSLATGRKYNEYRLENLGDENIEIPLGEMRARHLRTSGERATDIWLAYEYRLLPVKIRLVDNKGNAFVQVATEILFGQQQ
ncbi:hypothetical protein FACS1894158_00940 [Betaproteobacteria bacterium]|nr:hypothetical protein FACS1894158_00940 [Betaproteobacteria bacterium]